MPCVFQDSWLSNPDFKDWVKRDPNNNINAALCHYCKKSINISTMGKTALGSHMKGDKHIQRMSLCSFSAQGHIDAYLTQTNTISLVKKSTSCVGSKNEVLDAEILWCYKTVESNYSFSSNTGVTNLFETMFPDSNIAKSMSCAETKSMYMTCFGLAPYCSLLLERKLKHQPFVLMFDESLNKQMQKKQLDIIVRHWDQDIVTDSYFTSTFLGHACATDLVQCFDEFVESKLGYNTVVQLAMDGPNVNWAAFDLLQKKLEHDNKFQLINIGSCGLHQLHNAFRAGMAETGWDITSSLSAIHYLFRDVPARREDFELATDTCEYPLKVCAHRWVENIKVYERAIKLIPALNKYIKCVEEKKYKNPGTKSYETVKTFVRDPLIKVKLMFTATVATKVESFLVTYQTDKPMFPFLADDFSDILKSCMKRIVKQSILEEADTLSKLTKIDISNEQNLKHYRNINIGYRADTELKKLVKDKIVSERAAFELRAECSNMLKKLIERLVERSPLVYSFLRNLICLSPPEIVKHSENCKVCFKRIVSKLQTLGQLDIVDCDQVLEEFDKFVDEAKLNPEFQDFDKTKNRIDSLFYSLLNSNTDFEKLWPVIRKLVILSHGQASVERGFSVNKEISDTNMKKTNLIFRRIVKDHLKRVGGTENIKIEKELRSYAHSARLKYGIYLDNNKKETMKRKHEADEISCKDIDSLKKKQKQLEKDIHLLTKEADISCEDAEKKQNFSLVAKSNSLRKTARKKQDELHELNNDLDARIKQLKNK